MFGSRIYLLPAAFAALVGGCSSGTPSSDEAGSGASDSSTSGAESSESSGVSEDTGAPVEVGPDTSLWAFEGEHIFFTGEENRRQVDVEIDFPDETLGYETILLNFNLDCPNFDCDDWDRKGFVGVVNNPGTEEESVTEVLRFITPYGVGGTWQVDVSDLRPLLTGTQTLRLFIDTWVGPGHANGNGWLVNAQFDFRGGIPSPRPLAVIDLWPETVLDVGDPANTIDSQISVADVELPEGTTGLKLRALITGHGQGNLYNCAEFCPMNHAFLVNGQTVSREIWRDDCVNNPVQPQGGNWQPPRAGWCPGADVIPWVEDVSAALNGTQVSVQYGLQDYENSCRPDAPVCEGCALGTSCEYDQGNHTPPQYRFSAKLVAFGD